MTPWQRNSGDDAFKSVACGAARVTAGGAGDNTAVTGVSIDRTGFGCAELCIAYKTTLAASATLKFAVEYQESSDGSSWDTAVALQAATTAETGAQTDKVGQVRFSVDLTGKKQYIRFNYTPDLSAGATDTADTAAVAVLGGPDVIPHA